MLLRPSVLLTVAAGLVAARTGSKLKLDTRDFATISGALDNVNALLSQINSQILNLDAENIGSAGPVLVVMGRNIRPALDTIRQQVAGATPLNAQESNNLNAARVALGKNVNLTVSDLLTKKTLFDTVNLSPSVAEILSQTRAGSDGLFAAITSKLAPVDTNAGLANLFTQELSVFDTAIAVFSGQATVAAPPPPQQQPPAPAPAAAASAAPVANQPPVSGTGMKGPDGSCVCPVTCPVGVSGVPA